MGQEITDSKGIEAGHAQELEVVPTNTNNEEKRAENGGVEEDDGYIHHKVSLPSVYQCVCLTYVQMNLKLFLSLMAMAFLWVGSQIPLYLFGSVLPLIYSDIGGVDRYVWFVIGYLIPNAALW
jgi:hypothetical protein